MGMEETSQKLGKYLLEGWTMTSNTCCHKNCGAPLMRSREGETICVDCDTTAPTKAEFPSFPTEVPFTAADEPANTCSSVDEGVSLEIGKRMLQGWRLMSDICIQSTCNGIPLVQDKQKRMQCVKCQQLYVLERDADVLPKTIATSTSSNAALLQLQSSIAATQSAIMENIKKSTSGTNASADTFELIQLESKALTALEELKIAYLRLSSEP